MDIGAAERQEKAMRARSILGRRAQTTGSTHNFKEIVQMCAKNFAQIKKTRPTSCFLVELLTRLELVTSSLPRMCSTS